MSLVELRRARDEADHEGRAEAAGSGGDLAHRLQAGEAHPAEHAAVLERWAAEAEEAVAQPEAEDPARIDGLLEALRFAG